MTRNNITDISPLMQRLFPKTAKAGGQLERYPARVFLCAYMVLSHPGVVFNTQGELEDMLAAAGKTMITAFEALLHHMAQPMQAIDRSGTCIFYARMQQYCSTECVFILFTQPSHFRTSCSLLGVHQLITCYNRH